MKHPIFLKSVYKERVWGGNALHDHFGYNIPSKKTGEYWAISAHPNGESVVVSGEFKGYTLSKLWEKHRELFGGMTHDVFPLLTKVLDVNQDLSIQVHPDNQYAHKYENKGLGKSECWYIIDCKKDTEIILGHNANSLKELKYRIEQGHWGQLLRKEKIKPGDFFYVPAGTIHALCKGALVLETQQNSDITYRIYDYDRLDHNGKLRELHLEKAMEVINVPYPARVKNIEITQINESVFKKLIETDFFSVYKWEVKGEVPYCHKEKFLLVSVINGKGTINTEESVNPIHYGDHFILPFGLQEFTVKGNMELIVSHP